VAAPRLPVTAALRVGLDGLAMAAVDRELQIRARRDAPNPPATDAPWPAVDGHHVWRWILAVLEDFGEQFRIEAIVPTADPRTVALTDGRHLLTAMMRPDARPPAAIREAFVAAAPWPERSGRPLDDGETTTALQLFWQQHLHPETFAGARWILPHANWWGFRLSDGVPASEASSLVAGGHVAECPSARPSTLARRQGWQLLLPALREPHRLLGRLAPAIAEHTGLAADTAVLVGGSDVMVAHALVLAAGFDRAALVLVREGCVLVPGTTTPSPTQCVLASLDRRPVVRTALPAAAATLAAGLDALGHAGPVVVAGEWAETPALAAARTTRDQAVFAIEADALWAQGAALLAHWGRRPALPRLAIRRVGAD
jgi:sugar (pentulose or hexulose) kinase